MNKENTIPYTNKMYLQRLEYKKRTIFLITESLVSINKYLNEHLDIRAWIEVVYIKKVMIVTFLFTYPLFQGNGYGSVLFYTAGWVGSKNGVFFIELDDMSTKYQKKNNIYIEHGMKYVSYNSPEMTGHVSNMKRPDILCEENLEELLLNGYVKLNL